MRLNCRFTGRSATVAAASASHELKPLVDHEKKQVEVDGMNFESIRPVFSGLGGGVLAILVCHALSRWVPEVCNGKSASTLIRENRAAIWLANGLFFVGLLAGISIYQFGFLPGDDWRGLALGAGAGSLAALGALAMLAFVTGHSPKEAYVAYAVSQKAPVVLVYGILMLCIASFAAAVASLLAG